MKPSREELEEKVSYVIMVVSFWSLMAILVTTLVILLYKIAVLGLDCL